MLLDPLDHAVGVLELVDRVLQLPVQHHPVGDHHDLVEHLVVARVQGGEPVRQPGDRVRLPRPGRVLHQVGVPRPLVAGGGLQPADRVPLMEPREDHRRRLLATPSGRLLDVDEPAQQVQPRLALPHLLPQVRRRMTVRVRRVPGAQVVALVERQEPGRRARQPGGHRDPLRDRPRSAPPPAAASRFFGSRSVRYWVIACSTPCPVSGFFSSAVATGMPLTNSARSSVLPEPCLVAQLPGHGQPVRGVLRHQRPATARGPA